MSLLDKRKQLAKPFYEVRPQLAHPPTYDNEIYVGPGWMREGRCIDQPMRDKRLTEEQAVRRMTERDEREARFWWFFVPSVAALGCAAWLFQIIWKAVR